MSSAIEHRARPRLRFWLTVATVAGTCLAFLPWISTFGPLTGKPGGVFAAFVVTVVPGVLLLLASRRTDLLPRLRQTLALLALAILLTAGGNLLRFFSGLGVALPYVPGLDITTTFAIWAFGLAALIRLPLVPLARGTGWRIGIDITIAVVGMVLAIVAIWTLPGMRMAPPAAHLRILLYCSMEAANLIVLNLILVRGPLRAMRRAVWCLAATIVVETTYLVALHYAIGQQSQDFRLPDSLFFVDYLAYLYAGVFFLRDPQPDSDVSLFPESLRAFNPLPMLAVTGVGALLILSALHPAHPALIPLAAGIVFLALLLLARVVGATAENLRLLQEEAAEDRRRQGERMEVMGRVAGGIAHIINNQMTVVLGHAELALDRAGEDPTVRDSLRAIGDAAQGASELAERLLIASGRRRRDQQRKHVAEVVRALQELVTSKLGSDRKLIWELAEGVGGALVSPSDAETILLELVSNAAEATPAGGRITIRVREETLSSPPPGMFPSPRPGRYSVLEVADTGRGVSPDDLPHIFEPFFTRRPVHEGRGLGLSVVYGIVASYRGGLLIDTVPGVGTRVSAYLPVRPGNV